jgi:hypothetical protein
MCAMEQPPPRNATLATKARRVNGRAPLCLHEARRGPTLPTLVSTQSTLVSTQSTSQQGAGEWASMPPPMMLPPRVFVCLRICVRVFVCLFSVCLCVRSAGVASSLALPTHEMRALLQQHSGGVYSLMMHQARSKWDCARSGIALEVGLRLKWERVYDTLNELVLHHLLVYTYTYTHTYIY